MLAVEAVNGRLFAVGGLTDRGDTSDEIAVYDPKADKWGEGPKVPGIETNGNGIAACEWKGSLYLNGMDGTIYRRKPGAESFDIVGSLATPRLHHHLVPVRDGVVLAVAGASRAGHLKSVEAAFVATK